jgi:hypothetical protein
VRLGTNNKFARVCITDLDDDYSENPLAKYKVGEVRD